MKKTASNSDFSAEESQAIDWLSGRDKVGLVGEGLGTAGGAAAGVAAAGTAAGMAGATTILGSTTLGGILGGVFVAATPVGWVIGAATVGGAIGYGITRLVRSGGRQDERREGAIDRLRERARVRGNLAQQTSEQERQIAALSVQALAQQAVRESDLARMRTLIQDGKLSQEEAIALLRNLVTA